jgi:hypothetical protein
MRISAYARATNPKYANFAPIDWSQLAGQLGTKARGALSTSGGAAKLGAGIGAGIGAINYLGSEDKSIGNLAGQVAGGAALGGAAGYGGSKLKNAWQARKAGNQALLPAITNASATNVTQTPINNQPFTSNAPKQQAQLPAAQQTIDTPAITVPNASGKTQSGESKPYPLVNTTTTGTGNEQISPTSQQRRPNVPLQNAPAGKRRSGNLPATEATVGQPVKPTTTPSKPRIVDPTEVQPDDNIYKALKTPQERRKYENDLKNQPLTQEQKIQSARAKSQQFLESMGVTSSNQLSPSDRKYYNTLVQSHYGQLKSANTSRNTSPFANFRVRRYNGFVY